MTDEKTAQIFSPSPRARISRESLAKGLIARLDARPAGRCRAAVIYLPTRRAARGFGEAFAQELGGSALLPQFRALGDSEEDDLVFDAISEGADLPPAIDPIRRQVLLAALVRRWDAQARGGTLSLAQGLAMADSLAALMDEAERQGADRWRASANWRRRHWRPIGRTCWFFWT